MSKPKLIGVIHLPPLPGSPGAHGPARDRLASVVASVERDCEALDRAGFHAIILENFGDAPFIPERVEPITVAAMTACACAAKKASSLPIGINVLRNDALSALAIAASSGASFIRVNVHVGAVVADQGLIQGRAYETLRARAAWHAEEIDVWVDVAVKHAAPLAPRPIEDEVHDAIGRGLAKAILVTGRATGARVDGDDLRAVRRAVEGSEASIYVASGSVPEDLPRLRQDGADGVIVGSWLRAGGKAGGEIVADRAAAFAEAFAKSFR